MWSKFLSRKFLVTIGSVIGTIAAGIGFDLDPELIATIAGAIASIYLIIQGVIDTITNKRGTDAR